VFGLSSVTFEAKAITRLAPILAGLDDFNKNCSTFKIEILPV
jgi:hypothetical protein